MVASKLNTYLEYKDKHDVAVSSWAIDYKPGIAKCRYCNADGENSTVNFKNVKAGIIKHSETAIHRRNTPKARARLQANIQNVLGTSAKADRKEREATAKTSEFEISLVRSLTNHKIPPNYLNCLQEQL